MEASTFARARALDLVKRFGTQATSFQIPQPGFELWFAGNAACVAYADTGAAWVAAGPPVASAEAVGEVAAQFVHAARNAGRRAAFFAVEGRLSAHGELQSILVGGQTAFDPGRWSSMVQAKPRLREQLKRAGNKGLHVEPLMPIQVERELQPLRLEIEWLIERWQRSKAMPPLGFLSQVQPFSTPSEKRYYLATRGGKNVGLAALSPVYRREGWSLEVLVRAPDAPNGTAEALLDAAVRGAADAGCGYFTMGFTPLAGNVGRWLNLAKRLGAPLYNFGGIERFRAKFSGGVNVPVYLAFPRGQAPVTAIYDSLVAFARGNLIQYGLKVLQRNLEARALWLRWPPERRCKAHELEMALR